MSQCTPNVSVERTSELNLVHISFESLGSKCISVGSCVVRSQGEAGLPGKAGDRGLRVSPFIIPRRASGLFGHVFFFFFFKSGVRLNILNSRVFQDKQVHQGKRETWVILESMDAM